MLDKKRNISRLRDEADIMSVLSYCGVEMTKRGAHYFILCPKHDDRNATNCYFKEGDTRVRCEVCGESFSSIDVVMMLTGRTLCEAADLVWEICGCPDWYFEEKQKGQQKHFYLKREDAARIRLKMPTRILCAKGVEFSKGESLPAGSKKLPAGMQYARDYIGPSGEEYLLCQSVPMTWEDLIPEDDFLNLVIQKASEMQERYLSMKHTILTVPGMNPEDREAFLVSCDEEAKECARIMHQAKRFQTDRRLAA